MEEKDGRNIQVLEELTYGMPFTPWPHIVGGHMKVEDIWISHSRYGDHRTHPPPSPLSPPHHFSSDTRLREK